MSFGWDSQLPIEQMWKDKIVSTGDVMTVIAQSEADGITTIGRSDVFVESPDFSLKLCHEGHLHVGGDSSLVQAVLARWDALGYLVRAVSRPDA